MSPVPFLDLAAHHQPLRAELDRAIAGVLDGNHYILGPNVKALEETLAARIGAPHALGVASGSDALLLALMNEDIGPGHEVITTPFTFFATGGAIARLGAVPRFVDIDPVTFNLDPARLADAVTDRTRAVMPVHLYGRLVDMDAVNAFARERGLVVIEDAAQSIGARRGGHEAGWFGDYGCFSFFPSKNLGGLGDGGLVAVRDPERFPKLRALRGHGGYPDKYHNAWVGMNSRLDELQAAVLRVKLAHLNRWSERRRANAARYAAMFTAAGFAGHVTLPDIPQDGSHVVNQYVLRVRDRDALRDHLRKQGIGCDVYYPVPLHLQPCFASLGYKAGDFPESERAAAEVLAVPVFPELTEVQQEQVVAAVRSFYRS